MPPNPEIDRLEQRLQEIEIKMAFLEKELNETKDASMALHGLLSAAEEEMRKLRREFKESHSSEPGGKNQNG